MEGKAQLCGAGCAVHQPRLPDLLPAQEDAEGPGGGACGAGALPGLVTPVCGKGREGVADVHVGRAGRMHWVIERVFC